MTTHELYVTREHTCDQRRASMHTQQCIRHLPIIESGCIVRVLANSDVREALLQQDEYFIKSLEHEMLYVTIDTGSAY